jgi:hypothetical protein
MFLFFYLNCIFLSNRYFFGGICPALQGRFRIVKESFVFGKGGGRAGVPPPPQIFFAILKIQKSGKLKN